MRVVTERQNRFWDLARHGRRSVRLLEDRAGIAAVEMALIGAIVFVPFLGGVADFGQDLMLQIRLDRALHAAVLTSYATTASLVASNASGVTSAMSTAVQNGYGSTAPATTAALSYYCIAPTGTRSGNGSASPPSCSSPNVVATYLVLSTSVTFIPLLNIGITGWNQTGGTGGTVTVTSNATVRLQ